MTHSTVNYARKPVKHFSKSAKSRFAAVQGKEREIVKMYDTMSINQIAGAVGTDYYIVRNILLRSGVKMRSRGSNEVKTPWVIHGLAGKAVAIGVPPSTYYRAAAIVALGGKCCKCGTDDKRVLEINHINGHNAKNERKSRQKDKVMIQLAAGEKVPHVNLLCANCNIVHEFERGRRQGLLKAFAALCQPQSVFAASLPSLISQLHQQLRSQIRLAKTANLAPTSFQTSGDGE